MGFHINTKIAAQKQKAADKKSNTQSGNSKFMPKTSTKASGAVKKPVKTGGSRGS